MTIAILIDQHREVHAITGQDPRPAEWAALEAAVRARGDTPTTITQAAFPANYRRGYILSADGATCAAPGADHPPHRVSERREQVVRWARRETDARAVLRGQMHAIVSPISASDVNPSPTRLEIWTALALATLAIVGDDDLADHAATWAAVEKTMKADLAWFLANSDYSRWANAFAALSRYTRAYGVDPDAGAAAGRPVTIAGVTAAQLGSGRAWAERQLYAVR